MDPESGKYVVTENRQRALLVQSRARSVIASTPHSPSRSHVERKTSLVEYLAQRTGHRFMRINNHEHTDLQEYLGTYVTE